MVPVPITVADLFDGMCATPPRILAYVSALSLNVDDLFDVLLGERETTLNGDDLESTSCTVANQNAKTKQQPKPHTLCFQPMLCLLAGVALTKPKPKYSEPTITVRQNPLKPQRSRFSSLYSFAFFPGTMSLSLQMAATRLDDRASLWPPAHHQE